jgi:hypothetical protein
MHMSIPVTRSGRSGRRGRLGALAVVLTAGLGLIPAGTATADEADIAGPLPLSVALTRAELPALGAWEEPNVLRKTPANFWFPACWPENIQLGEADAVLVGTSIPLPEPAYYEDILEAEVLRYGNTAAANAAAARWRAAVADCEIPNNSPYPNGELYIENVRVVANVDGVDVWAYDYGAAGYTPPTGYQQFFMVQRENVLYFVRLDDGMSPLPHQAIPVGDTVAAVRRHLDAL